MSLDDILKQFPDEVDKEWASMTQSQAGQIRKTTERLGGTLRINGNAVEVTTVSSKLGKQGQIVTGSGPHAVGILPADVAEDTLDQTPGRESGITSFERMQNVPVTQGELSQMADEIAKKSAARTR